MLNLAKTSKNPRVLVKILRSFYNFKDFFNEFEKKKLRFLTKFSRVFTEFFRI